MLLTSTTTWLSLFILGVFALFFCPYPGLFFTNNKPTITLPVCFIPVSLPVHTPDLHNMVFQPNTILSPDSFPFVSLPTDHQLELPDILRNEIPYQSISLMPTIHICHYCCYILIFPASSNRSPFFTTIKFTATSPSSLSFPYAPYQLSSCLLLTGAVTRSCKKDNQHELLPSKALLHSFSVQILLPELFPFFFCLVQFWIYCIPHDLPLHPAFSPNLFLYHLLPVPDPVNDIL